MIKCECGEGFHACSSCGKNYIWEYKYCSKKCWENSEEYKEAVSCMTSVLDALPNDCDCLDDLAHVLDDASGDFYGVFIGLLMDKKRMIKGE